jgi:hypothetical protein
MVPRLRHVALTARRVGGPRHSAAERGLKPASREKIPRGGTLYYGKPLSKISYFHHYHHHRPIDVPTAGHRPS